MDSKHCPHCHRRLPVDKFHRRSHGDGLQGWCADCSSENRRRWQTRNPGRVQYLERRSRIWRDYGLSGTDYKRMMTDQGGRCGICGRDDTDLVIDHDHQTGRVRGLLCNNCNSGLGFLGDDPAHFIAAAAWVAGDRDERGVRPLF